MVHCVESILMLLIEVAKVRKVKVLGYWHITQWTRKTWHFIFYYKCITLTDFYNFYIILVVRL